jgi:hypothetical protein
MSTQEETKEETGWILYQIGSPTPNVYRFVVTSGFQDEAVNAQLGEGEFVDSTSTLLGELGGDVMVLTSMAEALKLIADIAEGGTTANSLPNIARVARAALGKE